MRAPNTISRIVSLLLLSTCGASWRPESAYRAPTARRALMPVDASCASCSSPLPSLPGRDGQPASR